MVAEDLLSLVEAQSGILIFASALFLAIFFFYRYVNYGLLALFTVAYPKLSDHDQMTCWPNSICTFRFCYAPYQVLRRCGIKGPTPLPVIGNYLQMAKRVPTFAFSTCFENQIIMNVTTVSLETKSTVLSLLIQDVWTCIWVSWLLDYQ